MKALLPFTVTLTPSREVGIWPLMKSADCQMRVSPALDRFAPLTSTQVLGAITGFSPSAFATRVITGVFCAQTAAELDSTAKNSILRKCLIPQVLLMDGMRCIIGDRSR